MKKAPPIVKLAIIDFYPNWPDIVRSYLSEEGNNLKRLLGVEFAIEFFTPETFPLQDPQQFERFDLILCNIQSRDLNFGERLLACAKQRGLSEKVIFGSDQVSLVHLVKLAAKTFFQKLLEKPATNGDFRKMFETLYALRGINRA